MLELCPIYLCVHVISPWLSRYLAHLFHSNRVQQYQVWPKAYFIFINQLCENTYMINYLHITYGWFVGTI